MAVTFVNAQLVITPFEPSIIVNLIYDPIIEMYLPRGFCYSDGEITTKEMNELAAYDFYPNFQMGGEWYVDGVQQSGSIWTPVDGQTVTFTDSRIDVVSPGGGGDSVTITYNNTGIHTASAPGTATLSCSGKVMASDVVITKTGTANTLSVTYGGNTIVNTSNAGTFTLGCSGKVASTNIVVTLS